LQNCKPEKQENILTQYLKRKHQHLPTHLQASNGGKPLKNAVAEGVVEEEEAAEEEVVVVAVQEEARLVLAVHHLAAHLVAALAYQVLEVEVGDPDQHRKSIPKIRYNN
jgi:hypothetical protein